MKYFLLVLLAGSILLSNGQQRELVIRKGHTDVVNVVQYGNNPGYVFTGSADTSIKMWDVATGFDIRTFLGHSSSVLSLAFSRDGSKLISGDAEGNILLWDIGSGLLMKTIKAHEKGVNIIALLPDGSGFLSGGDDKRIHWWSLSDFSRVKTLEEVTGEVKSIGVSPDGSRIIMGAQRSNDVELLLMSLETGEILDDALKKLKGAGAAKAFSAAILAPLAIATSIAKKDIDKDMLTYYKFNYSNIEFRKDGKSALISQNVLLPMMAAKDDEAKEGGTAISIVELTDDMNEFKEVKNLKSWNIDYPQSRAIFNQDQSKILVNINRSIRIFDMENADFPTDRKESAAYTPPLLKEFSGNIHWLTSLDISPDYKTVVSSDESKNLDLWDVASGRHIRKLGGYVQPAMSVEIMPDGQHIMVGSKHKNLTVWDITTGQVVRSFNNSYDVDHIDISDNGNYMVTTSPNTRFFKLWNLNSGNMIGSFIEKSEDITWVKFDDEGQYIYAKTESGKMTRWERLSKKSKGSNVTVDEMEDKHKSNNLEVGFEGNVVTVSKGGTTVHQWTQKGLITDASISEDFVVSTNVEGEINVYSITTGKQKVTMLLVDDFDYLTFTPEFYYTSSKGAAKAIAFREGERLLPFDQMEFQFNRPDKVAESLGYASEALVKSLHAAYQRRLKRLGLTEASVSSSINLPQVDIDLVSLPMASNTADFSYSVKASDSEYSIDRLNVYVNEVPVYGITGLDISQQQAKSITHDFDIKLSKGLNVINTTVTNSAGFTSSDQSFTVNFEGKEILPELYIAAIGVSEYEELPDLSYAAKDANDVIELFKKSNSFGTVHSSIITNSDVSTPSILELETFLSKARVDDIVILFIAGHGVLGSDLSTYYFAVPTMSAANPEGTGLPYDAIEKLLVGIKSRNKLLLMDTCHAGELDSDDVASISKSTEGSVNFRAGGEIVQLKPNPFGLKNTFELSKSLFGDLRRSTGATVIGAARGADRAIEGIGSDNGLFTYCLLEGLRTRRADANRDRSYTVSELQSYIISRVVDLSGGTQIPTTREENVLNDFKVW